MKRLLIVGLAALYACGTASEAADTAPPIPPDTVALAAVAVSVPPETLPPSTTTTSPPEVATVATTPDRGTMAQITETIPPPPMTAEQLCNAQVYGRQHEPPAEACFRAITTARGWAAGDIDAWVPFAITADHGILYGESEHCPNRVGGDVEAEDCTIIRCSDGSRPTGINQLGQAYCRVGGEDTGFGQATRSWWGRNAIGCKNHGYCSRDSILASPYHSMLASVVILIEYAGSQPWCWSGWAINYHHCWNAPDR